MIKILNKMYRNSYSNISMVIFLQSHETIVENFFFMTTQTSTHTLTQTDTIVLTYRKMNEFKKHFFYGIITKKTNGVTIQCCINQDFIALYSNGIFLCNRMNHMNTHGHKCVLFQYVKEWK